MATYYVSVQRGSDSNNGTSDGTPWLTIGKALSVVAAGDTVYVGAGVYREQLTVATSGANNSLIRIIGDPSSAYLASDRPGRIHVTRYTTGWVTQAGPVLTFNNKQYCEFWNMTIDGASDTAVTGGSTGYASAVMRNCSIQAGGTALMNCTAYDSFLSGGTYGVNGANAYRCVCSGGTSSLYLSNGTSTVALGGAAGFSGGTAVNCTAVGANIGFDSGVFTNCSAHNSGYGFSGASGGTTFTNCTGIQCTYAAYGTSGSFPVDVSSVSAVMCTNLQRGGGYETGTVTAGVAVGYDWYDLRRVLEPWYAYTGTGGIRNTGTATGSPAYDILNRTRPLGTGTPDIGAWEYSDYDVSYVAGEYAVAPPSWKCHRANQNVFYVPVEKGKIVTASAQVKHVATLSNYTPRILLRGPNMVTVGTTHTGATNTWQTLTVVSPTTTEDMLMEFVLEARDTTTGAWAYFSDFGVEVSPSSQSPVEYGSCTISSQATVTRATATVILGGGGGSAGMYGQPYCVYYSANCNWLDNNTVYFGISFIAPYTGTTDHIYTEWKTDAGYGAGTLGRYSIQIYAADSSGYPTGSALASLSNWGPPANGGNDYALAVSLTAGNRYVLTCRNTDGSAGANWASPNTGQQMHGSATGVLAGTVTSRTTNSGYFGGGMETRACTTGNTGSWGPWSNHENPDSINVSDQNTSISPMVLSYSSPAARIYGHGYYSASFSSGINVYGSQRFCEYIPAWPFDTVTVSRIHVPVATYVDAPAGNLNYAIENGNGTVLASGTLCTPFQTTVPSGAIMVPHVWKSANLSTNVTMTAGSAYRVILSSPSSTSANSYRQCLAYHENATAWNNTSFGGTSACVQSTTGTTWSTFNSLGDMAFLLEA